MASVFFYGAHTGDGCGQRTSVTRGHGRRQSVNTGNRHRRRPTLNDLTCFVSVEELITTATRSLPELLYRKRTRAASHWSGCGVCHVEKSLEILVFRPFDNDDTASSSHSTYDGYSTARSHILFVRIRVGAWVNLIEPLVGEN